MNIKKIKPMFSTIVCTMDRYEEDTNSEIIDTTKQDGSIKDYQTVLAVGEFVKGVKVGDLVSINPSRFAVKQHQAGSLKDGIVTDNPIIKYNFDIITLDNKPCLLIQDRDIDFVIEEYE